MCQQRCADGQIFAVFETLTRASDAAHVLLHHCQFHSVGPGGGNARAFSLVAADHERRSQFLLFVTRSADLCNCTGEPGQLPPFQ